MKLYVKPVGLMGTNCYIAAGEDGRSVVIDPGAQGERLVTLLKERNLKPEYILLTHGHYDHIGGVHPILKAFPEIKIAIGKDDAEQLYDPEKSLAAAHGFPGENYVMKADELLNEGDSVTVGDMTFTVLNTPGHTRGGITYRCGDLLFTGDALFAGSVGRTDFYGGSYPTLMASVRKLAALDGDLTVLPGHGPDSTLDVERESNPYLKEPLDDGLY